MVVAREGPARREDYQGMPGAPRPGADPVRRRCGKLPRRHVDRRERVSPRDHRPGHHRKGLPHLGGKTVLAAMALNELESFDSAAHAKRNLRTAIEKVSARLGNTPTICRKCCVHPEVLNSYMDGNLVLELKSQAKTELGDAIARLK